MLKEYLQFKKITMYQLARNNDIPYSNINSIANGVIQPEHISVGMLKKMADALCVSMEEMYMATCNFPIVYNYNCQTAGFITQEEGKYYVTFYTDSQLHKEYICLANGDSQIFVKTMAEWEMNSFFNHRDLERLQSEVLFKA